MSRQLNIKSENIAALSGPNFAVEMVKNIPSISVIGSESVALALKLAKFLESENFTVKTTTDLKGVAISGALKNLAAIGIGIVDGLDFGDNTRGMVFSFYMQEILQIGTQLFGSRSETLIGNACLGDMIATSFSNKSRNRIIGLLASKHITNIPTDNFISEGKNTAEALISLASKHNLDVPGTQFVYSVLSGQKPLNAFNILYKNIKEKGT